MKVLVAIDQTNFSKQIIDCLCKRLFPANTEFRILSVVDYSPFNTEERKSAQWQVVAETLVNQRREAAHKLLAEAREKLSAAHCDCTVHTELRQGSARDEIINCAVDWMPRKIFLGAHGHSPNRLLGAVSASVARHASCSVELIRLKEPERESVQQKSGAADTLVTTGVEQ